ncbi:unnamed protein product, partial [Mesorhabditis belari]|uniref:Uncharacterized protein n=1 Tax=Mesorhabditis belari TaxID=2138241 RepID=A0AAF3F481_9BILA
MRITLLILIILLYNSVHALPTRDLNDRRPSYAMLNNMPFVPRSDLTPEKYIRNRRSYTVLVPEYSILDDIF